MAKVTEKKLYDILRRIADGAATPLVVEKALCPPARLSLTRMLQACGL